MSFKDWSLAPWSHNKIESDYSELNAQKMREMQEVWHKAMQTPIMKPKIDGDFKDYFDKLLKKDDGITYGKIVDIKGNFFFECGDDLIALDFDDIESVGNIIAVQIAKQMLESKDGTG